MAKKKKPKGRKDDADAEVYSLQDIEVVRVAADADAHFLESLQGLLDPQDWTVVEQCGVWHEIRWKDSEELPHEIVDTALSILSLTTAPSEDIIAELVHTRPADCNDTVATQLLSMQMKYLTTVLSHTELMRFVSLVYYDAASGGSINYLDLSDYIEAAITDGPCLAALREVERQYPWSSTTVLLEAYDSLKGTAFHIRLLLARARLQATEALLDTIDLGHLHDLPSSKIIPPDWLNVCQSLESPDARVDELLNGLEGIYPWHPASMVEHES